MKTLLSLFDYSGAWGKPFEENGWDVIYWDIKHDEFRDIFNLDSVDTVLELFENVDGVIASLPCTEFAVSGSQYWKAKDEDGRTAEAMKMVCQVKRLVDLFRPTDPDYDDVFFWAVENPVGRLGKLSGWDKPYYFNPCDFAGYIPTTQGERWKLLDITNKQGVGVTDEENELVLRTNRYNKKTCLFGEFNRELVKKPMPPIKTAPQGSPTQRLGGKSAKTKELRSNTPEGFAQAFYEANYNYTQQWV